MARLLASSLQPDAQRPSLFFRLPPELRNRIYHLCAGNYMEVAAGGTPLDPDSFLRDGHVTPVPPLLLTCRLIASEATAVLYSLARLRYVAVLGSTRVEVHAVGRFSPRAIHHLHLEIRPVCWQQACDNLARLVPRLTSLETLGIYLPRPMGWEQHPLHDGGLAGNLPRQTPSNQHHINGYHRTSNNRALLADSAWRALKPILVAAQRSGLASLELRGSYDRRFAKLAQDQLDLDVILGPQDHDYYITEEDGELEQEQPPVDNVAQNGPLEHPMSHGPSSPQLAALPLTPAIMIRRPPIVHLETETHQGHP